MEVFIHKIWQLKVQIKMEINKKRIKLINICHMDTLYTIHTQCHILLNHFPCKQEHKLPDYKLNLKINQRLDILQIILILHIILTITLMGCIHHIMLIIRVKIYQKRKNNINKFSKNIKAMLRLHNLKFYQNQWKKLQ